MNIFCTSANPVLAAKNLDDKRIIKMILETAQLLSSAIRFYGIDVGYRDTHTNHPCAIWTRTSRQNFKWLVRHGKALNDVYRSVYGKSHASLEIILECEAYKHVIPSTGFTEWPNCTDDKTTKLPITTLYQAYMVRKWENDLRTPTWNGRGMPEWYRKG